MFSSLLISPFFILNINYDAINEVEDIINKNAVKIPRSKDTNDLILKGMMLSLDKYSNYFTPEENEEFSKLKTGKFIGIGVKISQTKSGFPIVNDLIKDSPAEVIGIKKNDLILKIDGETTKNKDLFSISKKIQGQEGSFVNLEIKRNENIYNFEIQRREIVSKSVYHFIKNKVLIIRIKFFGDDTYNDLVKIFKHIEKNSFDQIILDLRDNPGGLLDSSIKISNLFMRKGLKITDIVDKDGNILQSYYSSGTDFEFLLDKKLSIIINKNSASAAEVLTGSLSDNKIATVYGEKSYGKASVQEIVDLKSIKGASIKITIAKYLTPSGIDLMDRGIEPDVKIDPSNENEILKMVEK